MFPSLVNCTTIDWFTEWPHDALEKVASKFLEDMDMDDEVNMTKYNSISIYTASYQFSTSCQYMILSINSIIG